jgi:transposase-like protein
MVRKMLSLSKAEKVQIVLASFQSHHGITNFCLEHRIPRSTFYRWRKLVLDGLTLLIFPGEKPMGRKKVSRTRKQAVVHSNLRYKCRLK